MRPAMRPIWSCEMPSVAEIGVGADCTVKLIGSAPNFSWSASDFERLLREVAGDLRSPSVIAPFIDGAVSTVAVEHERELVAAAASPCRPYRRVADLGELLVPSSSNVDVDRPLAGAGPVCVVTMPLRRVDRCTRRSTSTGPRMYFDRAVDVAGDERLVGGRDVRRRRRRASSSRSCRNSVLQRRRDPRRVAAVGRLGASAWPRASASGVGYGVCGSPSARPTTCVAGAREQHGAQFELRRRLDAVARLVVELAGDLDDDVRRPRW